jgi:hypothetical protein
MYTGATIISQAGSTGVLELVMVSLKPRQIGASQIGKPPGTPGWMAVKTISESLREASIRWVSSACVTLAGYRISRWGALSHDIASFSLV